MGQAHDLDPFPKALIFLREHKSAPHLPSFYLLRREMSMKGESFPCKRAISAIKRSFHSGHVLNVPQSQVLSLSLTVNVHTIEAKLNFASNGLDSIFDFSLPNSLFFGHSITY